jgi:8-oxo-dGTP pyrophosphatase MutT (NUDIX family)
MNTQLSILYEHKKLESKPHVDKKILKQFYARLKNPKILRSQNTPDHFCVFFLPLAAEALSEGRPFDQKTQSVYLGHHIKAGDWIPPGGHIEENESPLDALKREMTEELKFKLTNEKIELFDITVKPINRTDCQKHWDLANSTPPNGFHYKKLKN